MVRGDGATTTAPTQPGEARKSLAERRFEAAHAAAATGEADATDGGADETKELDR